MAHLPAPFPIDETDRLQALWRLHVLDTQPDPAYDDVVAIAAALCNAPIALISLVDADRQWFKACIGLNVRETHRDEAFCAHAIHRPDDVMVVEDATADARFCENPLVVGPPHIRFYAGAPIVTRRGRALGTVCVIDQVARSLNPTQITALQALARLVARQLEQREQSAQSDERNEVLHRKVSTALAEDSLDHATLRRDQRVDAVGQLTGSVAHDFNNLLQSVTMSLQLMKVKSHSPADIQRWADSGLSAAKRGADLVAQLLEFSREQSPVTGRMCVSEHVGAMRDLLARTLPASVRLTFQLDTDGCLVMINATQLEASVLNMVINSRDAMQGSGNINITTRRVHVRDDAVLEDGDYVSLEIKDDGPGMPKGVAERAFDAFFTTKTEGKGTGLGLSQVMGVAERAGGTARIESSGETGTAITMLLRVVGEGEPLRETGVASVPQAALDTRTTILLVDDVDELRVPLCLLLTEAGYGVTAAASGVEALKAAESVTPDVVLTDLGMQGISGPLLAHVLGELHPRLPVIFMTADVDVDALRHRLPPQAVVLQKPVLIEEVMAALDRCLAEPD